MANIIPYDDTPIVDEKALAKQHGDLVDKLKKSLIVSETGWIKSGQFLTEIKDSGSYKSEDSTHDVTWGEFLMRPDLPLTGITEDARARSARRLMSVWKTVTSKPDVDKKFLAEIGHTKLAVVAGHMNKKPDDNLNDWLSKAKELTVPDLVSEVNDGGKTLAESNACEHKNYSKVDSWRCDDCKKFFRDEPGKKKKDAKTKK